MGSLVSVQPPMNVFCAPFGDMRTASPWSWAAVSWEGPERLLSSGGSLVNLSNAGCRWRYAPADIGGRAVSRSAPPGW